MTIQCGKYKVKFVDNSEQWHLLELLEFDGEDIVKQNLVYIADENLFLVEKTLKSETTLTQIINFDKYSKITVDSEFLFLIKK